MPQVAGGGEAPLPCSDAAAHDELMLSRRRLEVTTSYVTETSFAFVRNRHPTQSLPLSRVCCRRTLRYFPRRPIARYDRLVRTAGLAFQSMRKLRVFIKEEWQLTRREFAVRASILSSMQLKSLAGAAQIQPLWNGKDLKDFIIDTPSVWSVRNGVIVGRHEGLRYNEFLRTRKHYRNFVLTFDIRLLNGYGNSGVQFRSEPVPESHEVRGYQADAGEKYWGALYDESRRRRILAGPPPAFFETFDTTAWHSYRVGASGNQITIDVDGIRTVNWTETEPGILAEGFIALQVHSNPKPVEVWFRNLNVQPE